MPESTQEINIKELGDSVAAALLGQGNDGGLGAMVREQVAAQVTDKIAGLGIESQLSEIRAALAEKPPVQERRAIPPIMLMDPHKHSPLAVGARLDGQFSDMGDFLKAAFSLSGKRQVDDRLFIVGERGDIQAALTGEGIDVGGALVPEEFRAELFMMSLQETSIRKMAMIIPMGSTTISVPAVRDVTHASGNVHGGVQTRWTERGSTIGETQPSFSQIRLTAKGLLGLTSLDNMMLSDSFASVPALIGQMFMDSVMWTEEAAFIGGSGAGEPLGILDSPAAVTVTRATASEISVADLGKMEARLLPRSRARAVWMVNQSAWEQLYTLNNGSVQVWHEKLAENIPMTLNGRPVIINEHMEALGTSGDIMLVDWKFYLIGDRQAMSISSSEHSRFAENETQIRLVSRLDGQPWIDKPLTPAHGNGDLSPFVKLS